MTPLKELPEIFGAIDAAIDGLGKKMIDGRLPYNDDDKSLMEAAILGWLNAALESGVANKGYAALMTLEGEPRGSKWWQNVIVLHVGDQP